MNKPPNSSKHRFNPHLYRLQERALYKKLIDEVFGIQNFQSDITWIKCNAKNVHRKAFGNIKDMILFYTKSKNNIWDDSQTPLNKFDKEKLF